MTTIREALVARVQAIREATAPQKVKEVLKTRSFAAGCEVLIRAALLQHEARVIEWILKGCEPPLPSPMSELTQPNYVIENRPEASGDDKQSKLV